MTNEERNYSETNQKRRKINEDINNILPSKNIKNSETHNTTDHNENTNENDLSVIENEDEHESEIGEESENEEVENNFTEEDQIYEGTFLLFTATCIKIQRTPNFLERDELLEISCKLISPNEEFTLIH